MRLCVPVIRSGPSGPRNSLLRNGLRFPPAEILPGREIAKGGVRSDAVVVVAPSMDLQLRVREIGEDFSVQALVAEAALERLDEAIFRGLARRGEVELHVAFEGPRVECLRREFSSVVRRDDGREAALRCLVEQLADA